MRKKTPLSHPLKLPLVGVTGGIGSGKTTVCNLFKALGRRVIHADDIARDLTNNDPGVQAELRKAFGEQIFSGAGKLNRKALADLAFSSPPSLMRLNKIVHPHVFRAIDLEVEQLPEHSRRPYVLIEAALIFESGMHKKLDRVILVSAYERNQIERVTTRDNASEESVRARMRFQLGDKQKAEMADFIMANNGTLQSLKERVEFYDRLLSTIAGQPVE